MKRILVDMSAVLIHHGHIRLLKKAQKYGEVIVALTTDKEIKKKKKFTPELNFQHRKEILESIKYVKKVISSPWLINDNYLKKHKIDFIVHGKDNKNDVSKNKLILFNRTKKISTTVLRRKIYKNYKKNNYAN